MICEQPGHLIHSPSGTRLAFASVGAIGVRAFLNQAMKGQLIKNRGSRWSFVPWPWFLVRPVTLRSGFSRNPRTQDQGLFRARHVVACSRPHAADLFDQIVERFLAPLRIEL